jgi:hypothetical protein
MYPIPVEINKIDAVIDENRAVAEYSPRSPRTICPALMLAANRNDKVSGRTEILVVSISTRNGFNQSGAPSGKKCAINILGNFVSLERIMDIHNGSPRAKVKIRCLDDLNEYGIKPIKLIRIIRMKSDVILSFNPLRCIDMVRFNWDIMVILIKNRKVFVR